jgi:uncharacterized protein YndB with AHSA1/START domain
MTQHAVISAYGELIEPATVRLQRLLPGPIERVWAFITDSSLRSQWLAAGQMEQTAGSSFKLTWRNDELSKPNSKRPEGFDEEHSMEGHVVEVVPPLKLTITWQNTGDVTFELEKQDKNVLLTVTHRRLPTHNSLVMHSAGWHAHLDRLASIASEDVPAPFWDTWLRLRDEYGARFPE